MCELDENEEYVIDNPGSGVIEKLNSLKDFVESGVWQAALVDEKRILHKNIEKWSFTKTEDGKINWGVANKKMKPILWFGIHDQINQDCWTVRAHKYKNENNKICSDHLAVRLKYGDLNWNILIDGHSSQSDYYYNWIAELGIDDNYVTEKAFEIIDNCPINVTSNDDCASIEKKLNNYFISMINL